MKKSIIFLMLLIVATGLSTATGATPAKKKTKARTAQTSASPMWNGDMPSGRLIWKWIAEYDEQYDQFKKKGYVFDFECDLRPVFKKAGVCMLEGDGGSGGSDYILTVYDTSKTDWLYKSLLNSIPNKVKKTAKVIKKGNTIMISGYF